MTFETIKTEDGKGIQMDADGWPMVKTPTGETVAWDIAKQAQAKKAADDEARDRRMALEEVSKSLGLGDIDIRKTPGLDALKAKAAGVFADLEELTKLRAAQAAGELDSTAEDKIKAAAAKLRAGEIDAEKAARAKAELAQKQAEAKAAAAVADQHKAMRRQALTEFWNRAKADKDGKVPFRDGSLQAFLRAAEAGDGNGHAWQWTGSYDKETGSPALVLANSETGVEDVVKGPDNIEPLSLARWSVDQLAKTDPILFEIAKSSDTGTEFGKPGAKGYNEQSAEQIREAAYRQAQGAS